MSGRELAEARENDEREWREDGAARALADLPAVCPACDGTGYTDGVTVRHPCVLCLDAPRCAYPDRLWGTCGIPESMHEETFAWAKGGKFFHEYTAAREEV